MSVGCYDIVKKTSCTYRVSCLIAFGIGTVGNT